MKNDVLAAAWGYHNATKHSQESIRRNRHFLDWQNQPIPFKIYPGLPPTRLSQRLSSSEPALTAIARRATTEREEAVPSLQTLAEILFLSAGITRRRAYPGGEILFRAAPCTGALYHIDLYLACGELPGLEPGVYHFSPQDFSLRKLRAGDYRHHVAAASGRERSIVDAPAVIISASTYWRNAWKYQARAYRHCYWDNGTILANLTAAAAARRIPAKIVLGFVDDQISVLLGLDRRREAPLSLVALGRAPFRPSAEASRPQPIAFETVPLSEKEIDYPAIRAMHEASSLEGEKEARTWREQANRENGNRNAGIDIAAAVFPLAPLADADMPQDKLEEVVGRRGSTREFARVSITFAQLSTMLDRATRGIAADFLSESGPSLNDLYLIVHAVGDLASGAYFFRREQHVLELLKRGDFRREAGYLGLGQEIPADASVNVYFMTDLDRVLGRFGNRGYRAAQLEAAVMGGKLYLAAYAQRLGASGLTFFDDDVTEFFSPHAAGKSVMFLIALGKSVKRGL
jgi:SagB-type dehydrogenase family enzyme